MTPPRLGALIGLVLGLVWAVAGIGWVLVAAALAAAGWVIGLVLEGSIDLTRFLGHDHAGPETVRRTKES